MRKAESLRKHLTEWMPDLKAHPDRLAVYLDTGQVQALQSKTPSFSYGYTLKLALLDYAGSMDGLVVALLAWIAREQPQLLRRQDAKPFTFEAELLDGDAYDLLISIDLGEAVLVIRRPDGSGYDVQHPPEPDFTDAFAGVTPPSLFWQGFAATDLLVESQDPAAVLTPAIPPES